MKIIEPHYVDFNTAKLLKKKGLVANCKRYWVKYTKTEYKEMSAVELDNLDTEIGIGDNLIIPKYEQWQVCEWLRVNRGIFVVPFPELLNGVQVRYYPSIFIDGIGEDIEQYFDTPQEAYSAAFDYTLEKLI